MIKRFAPAALALVLTATLPLSEAYARGGAGGGSFGGGGGMGGGKSSGSDRGSMGYSRPDQSDGDRLFDQARRECNGPKYPSGATPRINYGANSFTCVEPGSSRR